jgi:predicted GNAT family acetyltransferase
VSAPTLNVVHNVTARRFETTVEGQLARADYQLDDGVMRVVHTGVPRALEGRGIAAALVRTALEHARAEGLRVEPVCPYVAIYMKRHPETLDLLAPGIALR